MAVTLLTHNLAIGVVIGVALSTIFFSRKIANLIYVDSHLSEDGQHRTYSINGQVFFVSVEAFLEGFDFHEHPKAMTVNLTHAHLWDQSAVDAVDKVVLRFRKTGTEVQLVGLNEASATLLERLAIHDRDDAPDQLPSH